MSDGESVMEPHWMFEEEEERASTQLLHKFNVHWWKKEGDTAERAHPVPFPVTIVGKMPVATLWALWHRRSEDAQQPPYTILRVFDIPRDTEKNFYKAKS